MNELHLFAGAGGGILGGKLLGHKTVCAVEIEDYPRRVLLQRQRDGILPKFPIWDDVKTFNGKSWRGIVDIVCGGFPCQSFSKANHGVKKTPNLWSEMLRIIRDIKPRFVFVENVAKEAIEQSGVDLWAMGYNFRYTKISASDLGADHIRERYWLLAYPNLHSKFQCEINAKAQRLQGIYSSFWKTEPDKLRMANEFTHKMDRLKAIGNGQVPAVAATAFSILSEGLIDIDALAMEKINQSKKGSE